VRSRNFFVVAENTVRASSRKSCEEKCCGKKPRRTVRQLLSTMALQQIGKSIMSRVAGVYQSAVASELSAVGE
jgi:hypothetical protein